MGLDFRLFECKWCGLDFYEDSESSESEVCHDCFNLLADRKEKETSAIEQRLRDIAAGACGGSIAGIDSRAVIGATLKGYELSRFCSAVKKNIVGATKVKAKQTFGGLAAAIWEKQHGT